MCHLYLLLFPLFDLCLTSRYFHYFYLPSSMLILHPMIFPNTLHLPSPVFCSLFILHFIIRLLLYSVFCPYVPLFYFYYIFPPFVHYSLPSLSRDCQGFLNLRGFWVGYMRVGVSTISSCVLACFWECCQHLCSIHKWTITVLQAQNLPSNTNMPPAT